MYNELYHHGVEGQKWGVKNGPPYPLKKSTSQKVGEKRAQRRINYAETSTKKATASASITRQLSTLKMEDLRNQAKEILSSEDRTKMFGKQTIKNRAAVFTAGHTAGLGLAYVLGAAASAPVAVALGAAAVPVGASWIYYHYSRR